MGRSIPSFNGRFEKSSESPEPTIAGVAVAPSVAAHMSVPGDSVNTPNPKNFNFMSGGTLRGGLTPRLYEAL
jgi:hypothetical protein